MREKPLSCWPEKAARLAGLAAAVIGSSWLLAWFAGWAADWAAKGAITVKTNMALCQLLAGVSILLLAGQHGEKKSFRQSVGTLLAVAVLLIGGLRKAARI